jgi:hypothetical protein
MTDTEEENNDSDEEETESFINKKVAPPPPPPPPTSSLSPFACVVQSLNWEPTLFTANITFFGKKDGFTLFLAKLVDESRKIDANSIKWLLKPIVKVLEYLPMKLVRKIVEQLRHVVFSRLLEMTDEGTR